MRKGLPENWLQVPLGNLAHYINGRAFKPNEWECNGLPIIRIQNLTKSSEVVNYSTKIHESKYKVDNGDVLMAWSATLDVFIWNEGPAWLNQHIFNVKEYPSVVEKKFLFFALKRAISEFYSETHGTGMVHVTKPIFEAHMIPLPPLNEQKRIVAKLDAIMPRIDSAKERLEKIPAILKRFRQSVLTAAVTGKLTEKWREEHPEAKEWDDFLLKDLIEFSGNGISKRKGTNGKAITVLRLADFDNGVRIYGKERKILLDEKEQEKYVLNKGDILIVRVNGSKSITGLFIVHNGINEAFCDHFIRLKVVEKMVIPDFILYRANFGPGRAFVESRLVTSAGQNTISQSSIFELPIPLPPLDEQKEIVRQVDKLFALADKVEEHYQKARARVDALSQSVLAKAFRGELVPQDPDDEPAEKLLQRIREEKGKMENRLKTASRSARGTRRNGAKTQQTSSKEKQASEP
ncbi:Type-1 restriction enzyme EcoKI specificity protein [bioreactor metagenome]|uniref:Type-1 restriction enzyme EcoKI specificity protein n=1 Tax=bioreactor metagenome TaxID=1076179 RepID=A0A645BLX4_9ZZZZ